MTVTLVLLASNRHLYNVSRHCACRRRPGAGGHRAQLHDIRAEGTMPSDLFSRLCCAVIKGADNLGSERSACLVQLGAAEYLPQRQRLVICTREPAPAQRRSLPLPKHQCSQRTIEYRLTVLFLPHLPRSTRWPSPPPGWAPSWTSSTSAGCATDLKICHLKRPINNWYMT